MAVGAGVFVRTKIELKRGYILFLLGPGEVPSHLDPDYFWERRVSTYHYLLVGSFLGGRLQVQKFALAEGVRSEEVRVPAPCFLAECVPGHTKDGGEGEWPLGEYPRFRSRVLHRSRQRWAVFEMAMEGEKQ